MNVSELYTWEYQLSNGSVITQYDEQGNERKRTCVNPELVVRVSLIPKQVHKPELSYSLIELLPRHDCVFDIENGERFIESFGRGFIKIGDGVTRLNEYLHCIKTNNYRLWVFSSSGRCLLTKKDYEVYL